ncbi:TrmB family transcriptional regulator [Sulfolobales archaeon HS-7]|nr:TrmB family transcriptional regulator [Sulfolobales archaeon HS-7]
MSLTNIEKIKLPGGREVSINELLSFIYGVPKADIEILRIIEKKGKATTDEISEMLRTTKPSVSKSLNNLVKKGLIEREKLRDGTRRGRPVFIYKVSSNLLDEKIIADLNQVTSDIREKLKKAN